jgi:hypothetical protein
VSVAGTGGSFALCNRYPGDYEENGKTGRREKQENILITLTQYIFRAQISIWDF